ncbi:MAG: SGNH/GDSL hydrolase family protein [Acidobacteriota bacterium]|nr:SGNH/GDSL hydrolase family protein [Acidobacteriota bacterium]
MTRSTPALLFSAALFLTLSAHTPANAAPPPDHWVGTWAASPVASPNIRRQRAPISTGTTNAAPVAPPSTTPAPAVIPPAPNPPENAPSTTIDPNQTYAAADTTLREIVHISLPGPLLRIVLTNEFGTEPLTIAAAHIAISQGGSTIDITSAGGLTFSGHPTITIPPGSLAVSDAVALKLAPGSDLAVSLFLPAQPMRVASVHGFANTTSYTAPGNVVGAKTFESPTTITSWPFLKGIDVKVPAADAAIVAFGDSITDGSASTKDANLRWPDNLARRLAAQAEKNSTKKVNHLAVINEGIGGNRVLHDVSGPSALARFDRDVIAQAGVRYVILLEGINDIGHAADPVKPYDVISADDLIAGFTQMIERAHMHDIKVIAATLTPYTGAKYASPSGEAMRQALNSWVRTSPLLDGFIDFEKATVDPATGMFNPAYDSGDHLHPKDAGYKAMADSIDLKLFEATR